MAVSLDYAPAINDVPYDPAPEGGGVDRLRLYTQPERTGVPVVDVGPASFVRAGLYRFTFAAPSDGVYWTSILWRETATAAPFEDADDSLVFPLVAREPWDVVTGADLARIVGNRYPRAALDAAARTVSGLIEGWTRGRSVYPNAVPRDLAAVATAAALRLAPNLPQHSAVSVEGQSVTGAFRGFTLHEQVILNRYRRRSA